jgi:hypothetical protein
MQNKYRITAFTTGNAYLNGLHFLLDHIQYPRLRPLDELFSDHFMQGIFRHVKGSGELAWTYEESDGIFGTGCFDLSNPKIWGTREGKGLFELAFSDGLVDHRISQQSATEIVREGYSHAETFVYMYTSPQRIPAVCDKGHEVRAFPEGYSNNVGLL